MNTTATTPAAEVELCETGDPASICPCDDCLMARREGQVDEDTADTYRDR